MIERQIEIATPDGRMNTFICHPERDSPHPAIIFFMDAPGIREELRASKAPVSAVDMGFKRAFLTIIDTHVTTIVSAAFLFLFGTGPIRGFAVSLAVGLLANLFTSVYVSRVIFDWHLAKMPREAELSI